MLVVKNLSHYYLKNKKKDKIIVFQNLNFKVKKNEFVSFVGPSGCGKTTLVNIIAGYVKPVSGEAIINNKTITKPGRDRVVINQENDLFEWMTVIDNIKMVAEDRRDDNLRKYLKLVHLDKFNNAYPNELSGGMKKRLSLARALSADPEFIIMDEPFVSLDYQIKEELHKEFLNIVKASNKTAILVTHDIDEAIFLSNRVIVFSGNPTSIRQEIIVPFPYPRDLNIKELEEFKKLRIKIKQLF